MKVIDVRRGSTRPIADRIPSDREQVDPRRGQFRWWPLAIEPHRMLVHELRCAKVRARDAIRDRWSAYLRSAAERGLATSDAVRTADAIWKKLERDARVMPPNARPTDEQGLRLSWNRSGQYLEVLVEPNGVFAWFYTDTNDHYEGEDDLAIGSISESVLNRVRQLF